MDHPAREPLATYEKAVWRLAQYDLGEGYTPDQLDLAVQIVADVFWLSDAKVRHDLKKAVRSIAANVAAPARARREVAIRAWGV